MRRVFKSNRRNAGETRVESLTRIIRNKFIPFFILGIVLVLILFSSIEFFFNFREYRDRRDRFMRSLSTEVTDHIIDAERVLELVAGAQEGQGPREVQGTQVAEEEIGRAHV